jgi:inosose dehydratase
MVALRVANAPVSWAVFTADAASNPPWQRVLDEIAGAGYRFVELGPLGFMPPDSAVLAPALATRGLAVPGTFLYEDLHWPEAHDAILDRARATCRLLRELDAANLVVIDAMSAERAATAGRSAAAARLGQAEWTQLVDLVNDVARVAAELGLKAVFHPHVGTYVEFADEIDRLLAETDPATLGLCLDTGHAAYAGVDPVALARTYARRLSYLHLKDVDGAVLERVRSEELDFESALAAGIFCPLGRGVVDFPGLRVALEELGYSGYATVEQDVDPAAPSDPAAGAAASLSYLESVGLA